jgi:hypothetical protein
MYSVDRNITRELLTVVCSVRMHAAHMCRGVEVAERMRARLHDTKVWAIIIVLHTIASAICPHTNRFLGCRGHILVVAVDVCTVSVARMSAQSVSGEYAQRRMVHCPTSMRHRHGASGIIIERAHRILQ